MNKRASTLIRLLALLILVTMAFSMVACDKLPFLNKGNQNEENSDNTENENNGGNENNGETDDNQGEGENDENEAPEECLHSNIAEGKCTECGKLFLSTIKDLLSLDETLGSVTPEGGVVAEVYYVEATVNRLINDLTGEMVIEDETGRITVKSLYSKDGVSYKDMEEKPDECDKVFLECTLEKVGGNWRVQRATVIDFESVDEPITVLTVAEALELCGESGNLTTERYYVRGTVKTVTNPAYGAMVIYDETGEIPVYGTYSKDGSIGYAEMDEVPVKGDEVLLYCTLQNFNGTKEIKSAWLIEFTHVDAPIDESQYTDMTIIEAREADTGALIKVSGVVAQITYANGYKPSGVILVDGTSSIYVYDRDIAGQVEIGNTIKVAAEKTYWILDTEINNASKFGYKGANQLENATLLSNDKAKTDFNKEWISETTVKEIMDTPVTENITNQIFKVTALVKKAPGQGFVNYYIDDIDGETGSYVYTQCNGGDFDWLDQFDGKFCTVYVVAINAKSSASGCVWRFLPIEVIDEGYTFDVSNAPKYAVVYHGLGQFQPEYTGDPAVELITSVSSELLGFEGVTLSYSTSNESVVYFTEADGIVTFHCKEAGTATITVTATYGENSYSDYVDITVSENEDIESITVSEAIAAENNKEVTVHGIVGPSLANQTGFYLIDESGVIAVRVAKSEFEGLKIGHEVIIRGTRTITKDGGGQICIDSATILSNKYGDNSYSTESFITGKTVADILALSDSAEQTTSVYVVTATISRVVGGYSTNTYLVDGDGQFMLYAGGPGNYAWLDAYNGQTVTVEVAVCDWNAKGLKGCVLSITLEDGTQIFNELNFAQ